MKYLKNHYFKKEMKEKFLKGRTITYVADEVLHIHKVYLTAILNGRCSCSVRTAYSMISYVGEDAKIEDYFYEK